MAHRLTWRCLVLFSLVASARAGPLDDFTNNLFSDLAPVLALFGERATMQFMSQSLGWADCIALAMAPLGIITIIVSAIRVGGPMRLKAVIGRATENTSVAEMELMSSTSREVCELYNGESIVRCPGLAPVWEYICLVPAGTTASDGKKGGRIEFKTLEQAIKDGLLLLEGAKDPKPENQTQVPNTTLAASAAVVGDEGISSTVSATVTQSNVRRIRPWFRRGKGDPPTSPEISMEQGDVSQPPASLPPDKAAVQSPAETGAPSRESSEDGPAEEAAQAPSMVVIRNTGPEAPNISLNLLESRNRTGIRFVAVLGILLQLAVVAFFGIITYPAHIRGDFKKEDKAVPKHAFPLAVSGTVSLVAGLLLCAHVVEGSTHEQRYKPGGDYRIHVYWLQKAQTVSDQVFESFATYPSSPRTVILTSRRGKHYGEGAKNKTLHVEVVVGVFLGIVGFVIQFVGLRAMNAAASLAQLGAVGVMTIARALVRPGFGFAGSFKKARLISGFEIDWLAWKLIMEGRDSGTNGSSQTQDKAKQPRPPSDDQTETEKKGPRSLRRFNGDLQAGRHSSLGTWAVVTGGNSEYHPFEAVEAGQGHVRSQSRLLDVRRELSKLANFQRETSKIALNLATAMEQTLSVLFPDGTGNAGCDDFVWNIDTLHDGLIPTPGSDPTMAFQLRLAYNGSSWRVMVDDLDAALSLWTYTVRGADQENELNKGAESLDVNSENDSWLRNKIHPASLRILCPANNEMRDQMVRDLTLWAPKAFQSVFNITECRLSDGDPFGMYHAVRTFQQSRVVGFNPQKQIISGNQAGERDFWTIKRSVPGLRPGMAEKVHWAIDTQETLDLLYAKDLLFSFFCSVAKTLKTPVRGKTEIETALTKITWRNVLRKDTRLCVLGNEHLRDLIDVLVNLELGLEHEVALSVMVPLSFWDKLPPPYPLFQSLCERKIEARKAQDWEALYLEVFDLYELQNSKPAQLGRGFFQHLFVFSVEHAQDAQDELWLMNVEGRNSGRDYEHFQKHRTSLLNCLEIFKSSDLFDDLETLYRHLDRDTAFLDYLRRLPSLIPNDPEHSVWKPEGRLSHRYHANKLLDWRLRKDPPDLSNHFPSYFNVTALHRDAMRLDGKSSKALPWINQPDISGSTPLHHAARSKSRTMVEHLVSNGADVGARDFRGYTALHYACGYGDDNIIIPLTNKGATFDIQGSNGATPLHVAAGEGNDAVLWHFNKTSEPGYRGIIHGLEHIPWKAKDFNGRLAVHWAVIGGHWLAVEELFGYVNERDNYGWTALHLAVLHDKDDIVFKLCNRPVGGNEVRVDMEKRDEKGRTALQLAIERGKPKAAEILKQASALAGNTSS